MTKNELAAIIARMPKITVIGINDWELIYIDDELFHWHDALPLSEFLSRLGVKDRDSELPQTERGWVDDELVKDVIDELGDAPSSLNDLIEKCKELKKVRLQSKVEEYQKVIEKLNEDIDAIT